MSILPAVSADDQLIKLQLPAALLDSHDQKHTALLNLFCSFQYNEKLPYVKENSVSSDFFTLIFSAMQASHKHPLSCRQASPAAPHNQNYSHG